MFAELHAALRQADEDVHGVRLPALLQADGPQFDDPIPAEFDAGGLRVKDDDPVKTAPKRVHQAASSQLSPLA